MIEKVDLSTDVVDGSDTGEMFVPISISFVENYKYLKVDRIENGGNEESQPRV
jgi:hypothetical protein